MYSFVVDGMTWSYSRLKAFEECPYQFFLKYIYGCTDEKRLFFSDYGTFMHSILEKFYLKKLTAEELVPYYLNHYFDEVQGAAPSEQVFSSFFESGLEYLRNIKYVDGTILGVEVPVSFEIDRFPFTGFVDLIVRDDDGTIEIWDHKSHPLKPRSYRKQPTKSDVELDEYLKQLYLYAIPVCKMYGIAPNHLVFNCYRKGILIREPFFEDRLDEAKKWAVSVIQQIRTSSEFFPKMEYFKCRYLCGVQRECEYFAMT